MANFRKSMAILFKAEFANRADKFLHKNKAEDGYTLGGIYQKFHKDSIDWKLVDTVMAQNHGDIRKASTVLFSYQHVVDDVWAIYKKEYWDAMRLDEVESQKIADEMFLFGVVAHPRHAVRASQRLVGATIDGKIGKNTLAALNAFDEDVFDVEYDKLEIEYFEKVADRNPHLAFNLRGWKNRAMLV